VDGRENAMLPAAAAARRARRRTALSLNWFIFRRCMRTTE
jgi:hypothetical protein